MDEGAEGERESEGEGGREILTAEEEKILLPPSERERVAEGRAGGGKREGGRREGGRGREGGGREGGRGGRERVAEGRAGVMDIMWPISQSHFHVSCLYSLK